MRCCPCRPCPQGRKHYCYVVRHRTPGNIYPTMELYLETIQNGAPAGPPLLLLAARRMVGSKTPNYRISLSKTDFSKGSDNIVGKLRCAPISTSAPAGPSLLIERIAAPILR